MRSRRLCTFGWRRIGVVGSMICLVVFASLSFASALESIQTLVHITHSDSAHQPVLLAIMAGLHFLTWCLAFSYIGGQKRFFGVCLFFFVKEKGPK